MKVVLALGIMSILFGVFFWPFVSKEKRCYETAQAGVNDIGYFSTSRSWDQKEVCMRRTDVLVNLEECLRVSTASSTLMKYTHVVVATALTVVRPYTKGIFTQKEEHNADCMDYVKYQLE